MTPEPTTSDADDGLDRAERMAEGVLRDELATRHLAYRRALEALAQQVDQELKMLQATAYVPETHVYSNQLVPAWRIVRECRDVMAAARDALKRHQRQAP